MRVGVIGLGQMGMPIALNLIERGFKVTGHRRHPAPELIEAGGRFASSPAELAAECDVLLSILPSLAAVREITSGPEGTLSTMKQGTIHIEMSTLPAADKAVFRDTVVARGGDLLDAPISGGPMMVRPRLNSVFVSGDERSYLRVRPVLEAVAGPCIYTGAFGTGASLKYVANLLVASHMVAAAEAFALAKRSGLDLDLTFQTISNSIAGSAILNQRGPMILKGQYSPAPGPINMLWDVVTQIENHVLSMGLELPVFTAAKKLFEQAVASGFGELDIAAVHHLIEGSQPPTPDVGQAGPDRTTTPETLDRAEPPAP